MNRGVEIGSEIADDIDRSLIRSQVEMGVAVRMACLEILARGPCDDSRLVVENHGAVVCPVAAAASIAFCSATCA
jgi:hypothetical protein